MLHFKNYRKYYGDNLILDIPMLELEAGIFWLIGANGAGKTTLMQSIAGLIPFEGGISVAGVVLSRQRTHYCRIVNYAEAEPVYPAFLTGEDIIRFYATAKMAPESQIRSVADALDISGFIQHKTGTYSSGMMKKLSLALAFLGAPKLILLDEPLITLDQNSVHGLLCMIEGLVASGVSFLITSHQEVSFPNYSATHLFVRDKSLSAHLTI